MLKTSDLQPHSDDQPDDNPASSSGIGTKIQGQNGFAPRPQNEPCPNPLTAALGSEREAPTGPAVFGLADALQQVARMLGTASTRDRFAHTLPMVAGELPLSRLDEAAEKLGLAAKLVETPLAQASPLAPPFVAFTSQGDAYVVTKYDAKNDVVHTLAFVQGQPVEHRQSLRALSEASNPTVIYLARQNDLDEASDLQPDRRQHWFWSAASRFGVSYTQVIVAGFLVNLLALAAPLFVMNVYDRVIPNLTIPTLWALAAGIGIAIVFDFLLKLVRARVVDETGRRIDMTVSGRMFDRLLEVRSDARPNATGVLASHIRDFDNVRDVLTSSTVVALTDALFIFIFLAALYWIVGPLAAVPAAAAVLVLTFTYVSQWPMARAMRRAQSDASKRHGILVETLLSLDRVKALGGGSPLRQRFDHSVAESSRSATAARFWSMLTTTVLQTVSQIVSVIIIVWGVFLVLDAQISVGALIAANILSGRVLAPLASVAGTLQRVQNARFSFKAVDQIMALPSEWTSAEATRPLKAPTLTIEGLSFQYKPDLPPALSDVTFQLEPGDRLGIIGRIGSGKSTLGRLLCGLSQPSQGRILIDQVDLKQIPPTELRGFVGYVCQEPELLSGTLRENITLGASMATTDDIDRAIELAGLSELARTHPLGLSMPIAERGRNLSGGQRQSIALAQALIRRPKLLFLDEPTAALDLSAERHLLTSLERLSKDDGVTLLMATHRNSTLKAVSKLLVLERGQLAAFGPRDEVLKVLEQQAIAS